MRTLTEAKPKLDRLGGGEEESLANHGAISTLSSVLVGGGISVAFQVCPGSRVISVEDVCIVEGVVA